MEQGRLPRRQKKSKGSIDQVSTFKTSFNLDAIRPITESQRLVFESFEYGYHQILTGVAGTGKTFLAMYLALDSVINQKAYNKVLIVRSSVPSRDMGYLPGKPGEKMAAYELPYRGICSELFGRDDAYEILKQKNGVEFISTSFLRGTTFKNVIVIVDEIQNMSFQELSTVITRMGDGCRLIMCGDHVQDDLTSERYREESGFDKFIRITDLMDSIERTEFTVDDVVRGGLVKEYILAVEHLKTLKG